MSTLHRPLGRTDLQISAVVFGAMSFARRDPAQRERTLHAAVEAGITSIDTAPLYEFGESERMVGRAIADRRDRVQVLTKVGLRWDDDHGDVLFTTVDEHGAPRVVRRDSRPQSVRRDVEQSLQRLGVDTLDLCQVHHPDPHVPIADTMGELLRLREQGKLRAIGVSNYSAQQVEQAKRALGDVPLASLQSEYSLLSRGVERDGLLAVRHHGLGFLAYSPLKHGLLAGRRRLAFDDDRRYRPVFAPVNVARIDYAREHGLGPLARHHGLAEAQVALAWVLGKPGVTAVIAGASDEAQVRANVAAAGLRLRAGEQAGLEAEFGRVWLDPSPRPRRRDRLRERVQRVAHKITRRLGRRGR